MPQKAICYQASLFTAQYYATESGLLSSLAIYCSILCYRKRSVIKPRYLLLNIMLHKAICYEASLFTAQYYATESDLLSNLAIYCSILCHRKRSVIKPRYLLLNIMLQKAICYEASLFTAQYYAIESNLLSSLAIYCSILCYRERSVVKPR